jgi:hypothetical protein
MVHSPEIEERIETALVVNDGEIEIGFKHFGRKGKRLTMPSPEKSCIGNSRGDL